MTFICHHLPCDHNKSNERDVHGSKLIFIYTLNQIHKIHFHNHDDVETDNEVNADTQLLFRRVINIISFFLHYALKTSSGENVKNSNMDIKNVKK